MGERATPAGEFFRWRPAGVGRRGLPCPRCDGARTPVRLLENLLEALCAGCGRNLALERARVIERDAGPDELLTRLRAMGALDESDAPAPLEALIERGALRRDLRLTLDLDLEARAFAYGAAPLRDLVLAEEVERALEDRRARGGVLNELLRARALERVAASLRGVGLDVGLEALIDPSELDPACRRALPARALAVYRAVPVRRDEGALVVALWDPLDEEVVSDLEALVEGPVHAVLASPDAMARALADLGVPPDDGAGGELPADEREVAGGEAAPLELDDPFEGILLEALEEGASEVLVEPRGGRGSLRFRVRGELRKEREVAADVAATLAERLEELALEPQRDRARVRLGRARCEVSGLPVALDFRVLATPLGPSVAIELEGDEGQPAAGLSQLGLSLDALAAFEAVLARGTGIVVVAAPRRGGKTAAYYAILERATRIGGAVVSLERRPRQALLGVTQLDALDLADLGGAADYAGALLHPVPDWLGLDDGADDAMRLVVDVALAGGAVVVTVTAPDAHSALLRLQLAGLPAELARTHVRAVLARRVVPRVCPRCRFSCQQPKAPTRRLRLDPALLERLPRWVGLGCPACADQGTSGVLTLTELMRPGPAGELLPLPGSTPLAARALQLVREGDAPLEALADLLRE